MVDDVLAKVTVGSILTIIEEGTGVSGAARGPFGMALLWSGIHARLGNPPPNNDEI